VKPVGNDGVYEASSGTVELEVSATYNADISLLGVNFERWDEVNQQMIVIGADSSPPYQASVAVNALNRGWNQIRAVAVDAAYNRGVALIGIYRQGGEEVSCPQPTVTFSPPSGKSGDTITVQGKGWRPGGIVGITLTDGSTQYDVGSVQVPDSGQWEIGNTVPDAPHGDYNLVVSENHEGCELRITEPFTIVPNQPPIITLNGDDPQGRVNIIQGCPFVDPVTAHDPEDGNLTDSIVVTGSVDINAPNRYSLTYYVEDSGKLSDTKTREVIVFGFISNNPPCVFEKPTGRAPNLLVLVHGCCTDPGGVYFLRKNFGDAIHQVLLQDPSPEPWEIVVWDWRKNEKTGADQTPKPPLPVPPVTELEAINFILKLISMANTAYKAAVGDDIHEGEGKKLANAINQADANNQKFKYKYIHLIAHSAGSKLIDEAAKKLSELKNEKNAEKPFIHLTFLDAYTPNDEDRNGTGSYGSLLNYPNHNSEHYVDRTISPIPDLNETNAILPNAFNFDVTNWEGADKSEWYLFGHWWPVYWYMRSITFDDGFPGFPLSFEGGNNQFNELRKKYPLGKQCFLKSTTDTCVPQ
jgi:Domain of unknown function (DUF5011)